MGGRRITVSRKTDSHVLSHEWSEGAKEAAGGVLPSTRDRGGSLRAVA